MLWSESARAAGGKTGALILFFLASGVPGLAQAPPCTFTLSPSSATVPAGGGTGTVAVTASASNCPRTATSNADWITITFGAAGTGDGTVGYAVPANPTLDPRTGTLTIGGQTFTLTQSGGSCSFSISPTSATVSGNGATSSFTVVATTGCNWTATSSAPWVTVNTPHGTGTGSVSYTVAPNPSPTVRTATITVGTQTFSVVQSPACSLTLAPPGISVPAAGASGTVTVTANASSCDRSVTSEVPWVTITFGATGTGSGQFGYAVAPNTTGQARTGTVKVGAQTFNVYQEGGACTIVLSPPSVSLEPKGGTGTITVTATPGCNWTATSTADWITISFGATGTGDGLVGFAVPANSALTSRSGAINIGGQSVTVFQAGAACSYSLSPGSATLAPTGGSGSFTVNATAGCSWTAVSNADWFVISGGSGSGTGTVTYLAAPNTTPNQRSASVTVATQVFTATQPAACTLILNPASLALPASSFSGTVTVTASSSGCDRSVFSPVSWITITSGATGSGSGSFNFTVAANDTAQVRTATLTVGGQTLNVTQAAATCSVVVTPSSPVWPSAGGAGSLSVVTNCSWTAVSNSDWIAVLSGASGTGNGTVRYAVAANSSTETRVGSITIGGEAVGILQAGVPCTVSLAASRASFPAAGGAGSVEVLASGECAWTAVSGASWILLGPGSNGTGNGTVPYTVAANTLPQPRTGVITVANQLFNITQPAATCELTLSPSSATIPSGGGTGSFTVTSNCSWTVSAAARWIMLSPTAGTGEGSVSFTATANSSAEGRTAVITVGGQDFTVAQAGISCHVTLVPSSADVPGSGGAGTVSVASGTGCKWTPFSQADWIKITSWSNISGTGVVQYSASPNPAREPRTGSLMVGGQTFTIIQGPAEIVLAAQRVVNAASYLAGPLAPGEIVSLFGAFTGPVSPATLELSRDGKFVTTTLAGTQVFFDDLPAPLLYVSDTQVSAIVPFALAGKSSTQLKLVHQGLQSKPVTLKVAPAAPALFTADASGKGQGAILNQDYKLNSAANPAARNSVVMLFATGGGETDPAGVDGQIIGQTLPKPLLPVSVRIGGVNARVLYAGAAPGLVSGVLQVNVQVPAQVTPGSTVPVVVRVGEAESQSQVTLAVK